MAFNNADRSILAFIVSTVTWARLFALFEADPSEIFGQIKGKCAKNPTWHYRSLA